MARILTINAHLVAVILNLVIDFELHLVGAVDPTLLRPNAHDTIIDEKDDANLLKKSNTLGQSNDISFKYLNYRIGNRTNSVQNAEVVNQLVFPNNNTLRSTDIGKNGSLALTEGVVSNSQFVKSAQQKEQNANAHTGVGTRHFGSQDNSSSVAKALAFYESILANAKKNEKESRHMKTESDGEQEKNYADGIEEDDETNVCRSDECREVSKYIKESLNTSTNPCEDFYTFACGGWKQKNKIPESENEITAFTKLTKKIENATHVLLTQPPKPDESEALVKARKFFASCMDEEKIEANGAKPALDFIKSIGGWSMCSNKDWGHDWNVYKVMRDVQSKYYPAPPFFTIEVTNDHLNSTRHLIKVSLVLSV